ncbi:MAG: hypothetical protein KDI06_16520 [Calditrichaeota bacterium]|nr:hypothetical protein [Calditrichota bacterium]HQU70915.1 hypothetical protein [Calditrichia bacterium]
MPLTKTQPALSADPLAEVARETLRQFMGQIPEKDLPGEENLRLAARAAENFAQSALTRKEHLPRALGESERFREMVPVLNLELGAWIHANPLPLPPPQFTERISGLKLVLTTMAGALGGGLWLSGLFYLLLPDNGSINIDGSGFILGATLGAGLMVLLLWSSAENKGMRRFLQAILGVASFGEIAMIVASASGFGALWALLGQRIGKGFLKRLLAYGAVWLLLRLGVKEPVFDRDAYRKTMGMMIRQWLDRARQALIQRLHKPATPEKAGPPAQKSIGELGAGLHKLYRSTPAELADAAAELLSRANTLGLEGLTGKPVFLGGSSPAPQILKWGKELAERYDTIGIIEEGDPVFVESNPVIQDGKVIARGQVRKKRR